MDVRVGEALTKSTKSRASCGGAMMKAVVENGKFDDAVSLGLVLSREWSAVLDRLAVKEQIMQKRQDDGLRRKRRGERGEEKEKRLQGAAKSIQEVRRRSKNPASCCVSLSPSVEGQQLWRGPCVGQKFHRAAAGGFGVRRCGAGPWLPKCRVGELHVY